MGEGQTAPRGWRGCCSGCLHSARRLARRDVTCPRSQRTSEMKRGPEPRPACCRHAAGGHLAVSHPAAGAARGGWRGGEPIGLHGTHAPREPPIGTGGNDTGGGGGQPEVCVQGVGGTQLTFWRDPIFVRASGQTAVMRVQPGHVAGSIAPWGGALALFLFCSRGI